MPRKREGMLTCEPVRLEEQYEGKGGAEERR